MEKLESHRKMHKTINTKKKEKGSKQEPDFITRMHVTMTSSGLCVYFYAETILPIFFFKRELFSTCGGDRFPVRLHTVPRSDYTVLRSLPIVINAGTDLPST